MAGILPPLTALLRSPQDQVRKAAADAIGQLADGDSDIGNAVVKTGRPVFCVRIHVLSLAWSFCLCDPSATRMQNRGTSQTRLVSVSTYITVCDPNLLQQLPALALSF